jgi:hypothetical protein
MTLETPSRMQVVRKQEKEPRLKAFISERLSHLEKAGTPVAPVLPWLVVARTSDSPVLRALGSFSAELAAHSVKVRAILSSLEPAEAGGSHDGAEWLAHCEVRWARNPRLVDAHEFLVLSSEASWVGDSMRRDPQKRDAFECYCSSNTLAVAQACRSFERLWSLCEVVPASRRWTSTPVAKEPSTPPADVAAAAVVEVTPVPVPVPGATRH